MLDAATNFCAQQTSNSTLAEIDTLAAQIETESHGFTMPSLDSHTGKQHCLSIVEELRLFHLEVLTLTTSKLPRKGKVA